MREKMILMFENRQKGERFDIEVPCDLTAAELVNGLNEGLSLGLDMTDITQCYLKAENPRMLLKGDRTLEEFGMHDGSRVILDIRQS